MPVRIVDFGMAFRAAHDGLDAGNQLAPVEWFGQEVVGAEAEALDLVVELAEAREDQDRGTHSGRAQPAQHFIPINIRQHQVQNNDIVVVQLADFEPVFAQIGRVADKAFFLEQHLDAGRCGGIIFNQENTHHQISPGGGPAVAAAWSLNSITETG